MSPHDRQWIPKTHPVVRGLWWVHFALITASKFANWKCSFIVMSIPYKYNNVFCKGVFGFWNSKKVFFFFLNLNGISLDTKLFQNAVTLALASLIPEYTRRQTVSLSLMHYCITTRLWFCYLFHRTPSISLRCTCYCGCAGHASLIASDHSPERSIRSFSV